MARKRRPARKGLRRGIATVDRAATEMEGIYVVGVRAGGRVSGALGARIWAIGSRIIRKVETEIESIPGIPLNAFDPNLAPQLEEFRQRHVRLIKRASDNQRTAIANVLTQYPNARPDELTALLRAATGVEESRARLWARDQTLSYHAEVNRARAESVGLRRFIWRTAGPGDERVRDEHAELEGLEFSTDNPPAEGLPGEPINCRCIAEWIFDPGAVDESD